MDQQDQLADKIIQDHTLYAVAAAAIPVPLADVAAVTAVQLDLIRALAGVYGAGFDPAIGKGLVTAVVGASAARIGASALKAVPVLGLIPGVVAQAGLSAASTYAVGHLFQAHFAAQGTIEDFDPESSRSAYAALMERGREFVRDIRSSAAKPDEDET